MSIEARALQLAIALPAEKDALAARLRSLAGSQDLAGLLSAASEAQAYLEVKRFDPNQPRDSHGRWSHGAGRDPYFDLSPDQRSQYWRAHDLDMPFVEPASGNEAAARSGARVNELAGAWNQLGPSAIPGRGRPVLPGAPRIDTRPSQDDPMKFYGFRVSRGGEVHATTTPMTHGRPNPNYETRIGSIEKQGNRWVATSLGGTQFEHATQDGAGQQLLEHAQGRENVIRPKLAAQRRDAQSAKALLLAVALGEEKAQLAQRLLQLAGTDDLAGLLSATAEAEAYLEVEPQEPQGSLGGLDMSTIDAEARQEDERALKALAALRQVPGAEQLADKLAARVGSDNPGALLSATVEAEAYLEAKDFNPNQPRDFHGRWSRTGAAKRAASAVGRASGGGGSSSSGLDATADSLVANKHTSCDVGSLRDALNRTVAKAGEPPPPPPNLSNLHVNGADHGNLFDYSETDLPRNQMPIVPDDPQQMEAFRKYLDEKGVTASIRDVHPTDLHATQAQLNTVKVHGILNHVVEPNPEAEKAKMLVTTKNGGVLDGHHRWAAESVYSLSGHPEFTRPVLQVNLDTPELLALVRAWNVSVGLKPKELTKAVSKSSFSQAPPGPPPDNKQPWMWFDGKWILIASDSNDGVPRDLETGPKQKVNTTPNSEPGGKKPQAKALTSACAQALDKMITQASVYISAESDQDDQDTMQGILDQLKQLRDEDEQDQQESTGGGS